MSDKKITTVLALDGVMQGPVVTRMFHPYGLNITFKDVNKSWLLNDTKVMDAKSKTVGQANRDWLHKQLDTVLNDFLNDTRTGHVEPYED